MFAKLCNVPMEKVYANQPVPRCDYIHRFIRDQYPNKSLVDVKC